MAGAVALAVGFIAVDRVEVKTLAAGALDGDAEERLRDSGCLRPIDFKTATRIVETEQDGTVADCSAKDHLSGCPQRLFQAQRLKSVAIGRELCRNPAVA